MAQFGFSASNPIGFQAPMSTKAPILTGSRANLYPSQQMMSYKVEDESDILPGVNKVVAQKITDYVSTNSKSEEERKLLLQDMHEEAIKQEQKKALEKDREKMKVQLMQQVAQAKDPIQQKKIDMQLKLSNFADLIRSGAKKNGTTIDTTDDEQLTSDFINANPNFQNTFVDYVNGKKTSVDLGKEFGLIEEQPVEEKSELGQGVTNVVGGAYDSATGLPRFIAQNLAKGVGRIAEKLGADETKVQELVDSYIESLKDFSGEAIGADTESGLYKGTKFVGDVAQIASPAGLGKLGLKAGQIASKVGKAGSIISKIAKGATEGVVDTAIFMPQSEQRLATKEELLGGAVIGGALPVGSKMLGKAKEKVGELGAKIYAKTIKLNPSQIKKIMKPSIAGVEPERWLLDRKIGGSLDQIQSQLDDISTKSYNELNTKAGKVVGEFESESGKSILSALKKKVDGIEGLEDINTKLDDLLAKDKYSLPEMFDIKRTLDKRITMYSKSGDPIAQETAEGLRNLRDRLRKDIDTIAESNGLTDLRQLSKEIQVSTEISNALENTIARESKNRAMSLTDLLVGGTVAGGVYAGTSDPRKTIQTVAGLLISKKILENPKVRTKIAIQLDKLAPKVQTEIKEAMINNTPLKSNLRNMLKKVLTLAGVKALPSNEE